MKNLYWIFLTFTMFLISCAKPPKYPDEPLIVFDSLSKSVVQDKTVAEDSLFLFFSFQDGDGDLGTAAGDTVTNIFYFDDRFSITDVPGPDSIQANIFIIDRRSDDYEFTSSYRLPYLTPVGEVKAIKGQVRIAAKFSCRFVAKSNNYVADTIAPQLYIVDRANNKSNIVDLPPIYVVCD